VKRIVSGSTVKGYDFEPVANPVDAVTITSPLSVAADEHVPEINPAGLIDNPLGKFVVVKLIILRPLSTFVTGIWKGVIATF
jgi:hypothetical protein